MGDAWADDTLKEECGVVGVYTPTEDAARVAFFGLFALQHRGQESAGIAVSDGESVKMHRDMGLVANVFDERNINKLPGHLAIGHTRYSTTGSSVIHNAQPVYCASTVGEIGVAHNGNLINAKELKQELTAAGHEFNSSSDSEVLARLLITNLHKGPEEAVREVMLRAKGAYSVTVITPKAVIGFRDPYGIRPLSVGRIGDGYFMASETCAFQPVGAIPEKELEPGEMVIVTDGEMTITSVAPAKRKAMCLFEFIYFARPDSKMYGHLLYDARQRMGQRLAIEHPCDADVVVPVPDSGIPAAIGFGEQSGIPFREGMVKSRYIHRTFIQPDQRLRELGVRMKLTPLREHLGGKRVVLVDDSIVRGTTTKQIVKMMFDAGASEVHVRITAPPIRFPCFYGIDMASKGELAAAVMSIEDLRKRIGATSLGYLSVEGVVKAVGSPYDDFCLACFTGEYPIPVPPKLSKFAFEEPPDVGEMATVSKGQLVLIDTE